MTLVALLASALLWLGAPSTPADTSVVISVPEEGVLRMTYGSPRMRVIPGIRRQAPAHASFPARGTPADPGVSRQPADRNLEFIERLINRRFDILEARMGVGRSPLGFIMRYEDTPRGPALLMRPPDAAPAAPPDTVFLSAPLSEAQIEMLDIPEIPRFRIEQPDRLPMAEIRPPGDPIVIGRTELEDVLFPAVRLQFEFDGDDLLGHADPTLDAIGDIVSRYGWLRLEIAGHTDNVGADAYNLRLSERRANAVRDYLLANFDIEGERLVARGYGSSRPLLPNRTHTERAVNRRVEFHVLEPLEPPQEEVEIDEDELIQTLEEAIREAMREGLQRPDEPRLEW